MCTSRVGPRLYPPLGFRCLHLPCGPRASLWSLLRVVRRLYPSLGFRCLHLSCEPRASNYGVSSPRLYRFIFPIYFRYFQDSWDFFFLIITQALTMKWFPLVCHICFRMSRFSPRRLKPNTSNLVIGTSRTKYIQSRQVGAAVHSYRGAKLLELCSLIEKYPCQKLNRVVVVAGFNDHRDTTANFILGWNYQIQLLGLKLNPTILIIPKTIAT